MDRAEPCRFKTHYSTGCVEVVIKNKILTKILSYSFLRFQNGHNKIQFFSCSRLGSATKFKHIGKLEADSRTETCNNNNYASCNCGSHKTTEPYTI